VTGRQAQARLGGSTNRNLYTPGPATIKGTDKSWSFFALGNVDQMGTNVGIHRLYNAHPATIVYILSRSVPSVKFEFPAKLVLYQTSLFYGPNARRKKPLTACTGTARPTSGPAIIALMPTSRLCTSTNGPPECPGRRCKLTWINSC
jgi:hypothetical protein